MLLFTVVELVAHHKRLVRESQTTLQHMQNALKHNPSDMDILGYADRAERELKEAEYILNVYKGMDPKAVMTGAQMHAFEELLKAEMKVKA